MPDSWIANLKYDEKGLIPAIAQDHQDGEILMMAISTMRSFERLTPVVSRSINAIGRLKLNMLGI